jgi:hypothetical protein
VHAIRYRGAMRIKCAFCRSARPLSPQFSVLSRELSNPVFSEKLSVVSKSHQRTEDCN